MAGRGVLMLCVRGCKTLDLRTAVVVKGQAFVVPRYGYEYGTGVAGLSGRQWNLLDR